MRYPHRDAQVGDDRADAEPIRESPGRRREQLPLVVRLWPGEQQERLPARVGQQEKRKLWPVVALPAAGVESHQRPPRSVVEEPVGVEPGHRLVIEDPKEMLGEKAPGRPGVHEPLKVHQHGRAVGVRGRRGIQFVEFFRLHASSLSSRATTFGPAIYRMARSVPRLFRYALAPRARAIPLKLSWWKRSTSASCPCYPATGA